MTSPDGRPHLPHDRQADLRCFGNRVSNEEHGPGQVLCVLGALVVGGPGGDNCRVGTDAVTQTPIGGWDDVGQVSWYLDRIGKLEARRAGESMLVDMLPPAPRRALDLGCGDGRLAALVLDARPTVESVVAVDRSAPMLEHARARFGGDSRVELRGWDLEESIDPLGTFDAVVSGFAIHHVSDVRKRALFGEIAAALEPGGTFLNLEVVSSGSARRHAEFLTAIGRTADDPEDRLAAIEDQVGWMGSAGFVDADCLWRWRGFALLVGDAPL